MKFSIIVPVHNEQEHIKRCVEALLNQSYSIYEIILVDDHSEDNSVEICKEYAEKYENIKFYESHECGVSAARNSGLEYVTGDVVGFCDSDDFYEMDAIECAYECFKKNTDIKMVVTSFYRTTYIDGVFNKNYAGTIGGEKCISKDKIACAVIDDTRVLGSVCNKYFSKEILEGIWFDTTLTHCEDLHFLVRVILRCNDSQIFVTEKGTYNYVHNVLSVTNSIEKMIDDNGEIKYNIARLNLLNEPLISKKVCRYIRSCCLEAWLVYYVEHKLTDKQKNIMKWHLKNELNDFIFLFTNHMLSKIKLVFKCVYVFIFLKH